MVPLVYFSNILPQPACGRSEFRHNWAHYFSVAENVVQHLGLQGDVACNHIVPAARVLVPIRLTYR